MTNVTPSPPESTEQPARYIVGIDLGTTNSAVSYVDTEQEPWQAATFAVPQLIDAGQIDSRDTLPSFHYQPSAGERDDRSLCMRWQRSVPEGIVGTLARDQGTRSPGRMIASAKSWLCHSGVDRTAELLPWQGADDVQRLSPVAASAEYLRHIHDAWNAAFPSQRLANQDVVLTLPASFDEVARELTVEAAAQAGLPRVILIEEPQAAFYAWIDRHAGDWEHLVQSGQKILVCDVGGGTTDFTLIRVRSGEDGKVQFHRVAVGDHLILGGDNFDLALAKHLENKLGDRLQPHQWDVLVRTCRRVKEDVLTDRGGESLSFNLPGSGSQLIGGGLRVEVDRSEACNALLDGFLPQCKLHDQPQREQSGFREFGLPYAADPAITRYLASFLTTHARAGDEAAENRIETGNARAGESASARPDIVLFNGGLFASPLVQQRLLDVITSWFAADDPGWKPQVLENQRLDLAVARGAAYYGSVRRGRGVRITAGLARTYYIGVEDDSPMAVCLVPGNTEPGQEIHLTERSFQLLVHQPVEFPLYVSSTRLADQAGQLLPFDREQMTPLPSIRTVLRTRGKKQAASLSVQLNARLTEIGTLEIWCSDQTSQRTWRLQFDVRSATQTDKVAIETSGEAEGVIDEDAWANCLRILDNTFGPSAELEPQTLVKNLAESLEMDRFEWPMSLLRRIWDALMERQEGRARSAAYEARWLNLLGFSLRPGYGVAVDDWRVAETWRHVQSRLIHNAADCRAESWILWRRIAGGLSPGQQSAIAEPFIASIRGLHRRLTTGIGGSDLGFSPQQSIEMWRLLGSLELLDTQLKQRLGDILIDLRLKKSLRPARQAIVWALGRIGSRCPVYGPLNTVISARVATRWLDKLMKPRDADDVDLLAVMQIARCTEDRYRDLPDKTRGDVLDWLEGHDAPAHFAQLVRTGGQLDQAEQGRIFGDALPKGLKIEN